MQLLLLSNDVSHSLAGIDVCQDHWIISLPPPSSLRMHLLSQLLGVRGPCTVVNTGCREGVFLPLCPPSQRLTLINAMEYEINHGRRSIGQAVAQRVRHCFGAAGTVFLERRLLGGEENGGEGKGCGSGAGSST